MSSDEPGFSQDWRQSTTRWLPELGSSFMLCLSRGSRARPHQPKTGLKLQLRTVHQSGYQATLDGPAFVLSAEG